MDFVKIGLPLGGIGLGAKDPVMEMFHQDTEIFDRQFQALSINRLCEPIVAKSVVCDNSPDSRRGTYYGPVDTPCTNFDIPLPIPPPLLFTPIPFLLSNLMINRPIPSECTTNCSNSSASNLLLGDR